MRNIGDHLARYRLIAATDYPRLQEALDSPVSIVLLMESTLQDVTSAEFREALRVKQILLHFDFLHGLSNDHNALRFLKEHVHPSGIVSTRGPVIRSARKEGIATVQRVFLIDGKSFEKTIHSIKENNPDAVEVMPGIAPCMVPLFREKIEQPIILGGLITTEEQVDEAFAQGADAVSLGTPSLWTHEPSRG